MRPPPGLRSLAGRFAVLAALIAVAAVLVTSFSLLAVARRATIDAAQTVLGRDAAALAAVVSGTSVPGLEAQSVRRAFAQRGVTSVVLSGEELADPPEPFRTADVLQVRRTGEVQRVSLAGDGAVLVHGRAAGDSVVLLSEPLRTATQGLAAPRRRAAMSAAVVAVVAAATGALLARALARPLRSLSTAARRMSAGEREVAVPQAGPREIAELAGALNGLAAALAASEARQRRFLLTVSHELRTPLTALTGYGEALADGVLSGDRVTAAGEVIVAEAARLRVRIEELLALARLAADDVTVRCVDVDLTATLRGAGRAWEARAGAAGVPLRIDVPAGLHVLADAERLRQVVDALVDNALRVLATGEPPRPGVVIAARGGPGTGEVTVEVRDGGPGLHADDLAVAFEPGAMRERYADSRPVGSGVGLALVGRLAALMGGRAEAGVAQEGGLAVSVVLPVPVGD